MRPLLSILLIAGFVSAGTVEARGPLESPDYKNVVGPLPEPVSRAGFEQKLDAQLPLDLLLKDETGRDVRLGDYFNRGKPVLLSLVYFQCPMLCTFVLNGLSDAIKGTDLVPGRDFEVITVSFNHLETPELAAAKKEAYLSHLDIQDAGMGWHFLTGSEESVAMLASTVGFSFSWVEEQQEYAHASGIMVATPEGRLSHYFYGVVYEPRDVRLALVDSSAGKIGSPVDKILLFCFHYDPATGSYSAAVMRFIQIGGFLTVACLGGFVMVALRSDTRACRQEPAETSG